MSIRVSHAPFVLLLVFLSSFFAFGQISSTAPLSGAVTDPAGAVIANADVAVKNIATGSEFKAVTTNSGTFTIPALGAGTYSVTITARGFKQAIVPEVKLDAATPATVNVMLEVGAASESVVIQSGGEVLQTQSANVSTTITGRQITELPFTSRDALDLVLLLPGTSTPGRPRTSTVNGLPKGSLNITLDGINAQDNLGKSSDGFFTQIRPRIDAIDEVTLSTATPGAESAGEGAVQIKFVTRGGTNDYRGSLYEYHRNPALNANYYFNNRDSAPDPRTGKAPRDRVLLNQFGGRVGGPISIPGLFHGKDRAFFFVNYEEYRLPEQVTRQRNILTTAAQSGNFTYGGRTVNLLTIAANTPNCPACTSTVDPAIGKILADIRSATSQGATKFLDANRDQFTFTNTGGQNRRFATVRFDINLTSKHHLENIWNYQVFRNKSDILNSADPSFPGILSGIGGQNSNRFSDAIALRSTLTQTLVNEARFGVQGGTSLFRGDSDNSSPAGFANQQGFSFGTSPGAGGFFAAFPTATGFSINNPVASRSSSRRNSPVFQFNDNVSYLRGNHSLSFGGTYSQISSWLNTVNNIVPALSFGVDTNDPANVIFSANRTANFPNISDNDLNVAKALYAILTGRVTQVAANAYLDEKTNKYNYLGPYVERIRQREFGMFAQDAWRFRPNLTLTGGLRWEVQFPFTATNTTYAKTSYAGLFGVSGEGNLFKPGTLTGSVTQFNQFNPGEAAYNTDWNNVAPSLGIAWSPNWKAGVLRHVLGEGGQSVIRAGYSMAFVREGTNVMSSILGANPGGIVSAVSSIAGGNLAAGTLLRNLNAATLRPTIPSQPNYPFTGAVTDSINGFNPNLKLGYVQSWTLGVQRELTKDTVFEVRYVGNRGTRLWRQYNLNEVNVIENGFLNEFKLAQANLQANIAAGRCPSGQNPTANPGCQNNFRYFGPGTGTSPLPITLAYFQGLSGAAVTDPTRYTSTNFASSTFVSPLAANNAAPITFATALGGRTASAAMRANGVTAGLARNFFVVNPDYLGAAAGGSVFTVDNGTATWYNALTLELRRRLSKGLLVQGSYTFAKGLTNFNASSGAVANNYSTLRDPGLDKTTSPFDVTHAFKLNWIHELPIGKGRALLGNVNGFVNQFVGGWEWHGTTRLQSGSPFRLDNVQLVGMTVQELQNSVKIRKDPNKIVYYLPDDVILNTQRAYNVSATSATGYGGTAPTGKYIAPSSSGGCIESYTGQCGFSHVQLYGPRFVRFDLSVVKRFRIDEKRDFEFRSEFLNAFNNINFRVGDAANDVNTVTNFSNATFGQTTTAYRDLSTTNDPGGRLIQFVLRFNF